MRRKTTPLEIQSGAQRRLEWRLWSPQWTPEGPSWQPRLTSRGWRRRPLLLQAAGRITRPTKWHFGSVKIVPGVRKLDCKVDVHTGGFGGWKSIVGGFGGWKPNQPPTSPILTVEPPTSPILTYAIKPQRESKKNKKMMKNWTANSKLVSTVDGQPRRPDREGERGHQDPEWCPDHWVRQDRWH